MPIQHVIFMACRGERSSHERATSDEGGGQQNPLKEDKILGANLNLLSVPTRFEDPQQQLPRSSSSDSVMLTARTITWSNGLLLSWCPTSKRSTPNQMWRKWGNLAAKTQTSKFSDSNHLKIHISATRKYTTQEAGGSDFRKRKRSRLEMVQWVSNWLQLMGQSSDGNNKASLPWTAGWQVTQCSKSYEMSCSQNKENIKITPQISFSNCVSWTPMVSPHILRTVAEFSRITRIQMYPLPKISQI